MRRNPTSISALWLFLLSSLAGRNSFLALSLRRSPVTHSQASLCVIESKVQEGQP